MGGSIFVSLFCPGVNVKIYCLKRDTEGNDKLIQKNLKKILETLTFISR